ncbi:MAG: response regulator [Desulfobulbaceae bacterium]|nr:response regulator [Desulfobulbaceae bacterium]
MVRKMRLMIVDDNVDTVELLTKRFRAQGYDTVAAYDGEQALRMVREKMPDIILLDIMMPKIDGYEVCRQLKEDESTRHIPILMLTAKSQVPEKVRGLDTGADGYLTKPFDYNELAARVRSLLARKDASMEMAQKEKLAALDHMVDEVSHEVRNPLVTIGGFARRIGKSLAADDPNRKYIDIILQNVASLEKMVTQLVALKSALVANPQPEDINEIVRESLARYEEQIKKNNIMVETRFMENPPLVAVDHGNLVTALANIIENGIEAMEQSPRKELAIQTGVEDVFFEIGIIDSGRGIPADTIKNIYNPFYTSKTYGPGLGLTFALKTIQSHRGTISVQSEIGKGASFTVRLPLKTEVTQV